MPAFQSIRILDTHTGGEPTRVVLAGGPELGNGPHSERVKVFREQHDRFRTAIVGEPRGSDVMVGALLVEPHAPGCAFGVIFFNNVGCLGMCGHGTIGVIVALAHLGRIQPGPVRLDTPVGPVTATLAPGGEVSLENVPSYRKACEITVNVPGRGEVRGDVAWGGNWFFLVEEHGPNIELANLEALTDFSWRVRREVNARGFPEVDHVELHAIAPAPGVHSRNFVLCPGKAYDRSPCGTGTSAKLACLAAAGRLAEGAVWVQESIIGSVFRGSYRWLDRAKGEIVPTITGTAHVTAEATLLIDPADPFAWGIR